MTGTGEGMDDEFVLFVVGARPRLRRVAFLICGDWHRAEDIVQTALARVYRHWTRVCRSGGPWAYTQRAVVNAAIDERRALPRGERLVADPPETAATPDHALTPRIIAALSALPSRQRAVVVLRYVEDLDIEQTADLLGIAAGTVKSQAAKGLTALRSELGPKAPADESEVPHDRIR